MEQLDSDLGSLGSGQVLGLFSKMMRNLSKHLRTLQEEEVAKSLPKAKKKVGAWGCGGGSKVQPGPARSSPVQPGLLLSTLPAHLTSAPPPFFPRSSARR